MNTWRYATRDDVLRFFADDPPPQTIQAVVVFRDDEPVIMIGLSFEGDRQVFFSDVKPEGEAILKSMTTMRALKAAQRMVRNAKMPVIVQNTSNPRLVERLGFTEVQPGVHLCLS